VKRLPAPTSTFRELIEEDRLYVDKTRSVYEMVNGVKFNFLSRPRRFGKSLLLSTV
jgi:hypothetical protein